MAVASPCGFLALLTVSIAMMNIDGVGAANKPLALGSLPTSKSVRRTRGPVTVHLAFIARGVSQNSLQSTSAQREALKEILAVNGTTTILGQQAWCGTSGLQRLCTSDDIELDRSYRRDVTVEFTVYVADGVSSLACVANMPNFLDSAGFAALLNQVSGWSGVSSTIHTSYTGTDPAEEADSELTRVQIAVIILGVALIFGCVAVVYYLYCSADNRLRMELSSSLSKREVNIPAGLTGDKVVFASLRFPDSLQEARQLQDDLALRGVTLKIVDVDAGGDVDMEVFTWLDFADTMVVFGTARYGEDTGNPACTYKELKYAQCTNKRIILLRMIPWDDHYEHLAAKVLFNQNMLCLEWQPGTPLPEGISDTIVQGIGIDEGAEPPAYQKPMRERLMGVFRFLDRDDTGFVDVHEICRWGKTSRGRPYTEEEIRHILDAYDKDGDGRISLQEWIDYHEATHANELDDVAAFGGDDAMNLASSLRKEEV